LWQESSSTISRSKQTSAGSQGRTRKRKTSPENANWLHTGDYSVTDRILWRTESKTVRELTNEELEVIEETIAENFDVLDESTVAAWDTKKIDQV
jgi:hypothetical protein